MNVPESCWYFSNTGTDFLSSFICQNSPTLSRTIGPSTISHSTPGLHWSAWHLILGEALKSEPVKFGRMIMSALCGSTSTQLLPEYRHEFTAASHYDDIIMLDKISWTMYEIPFEIDLALHSCPCPPQVQGSSSPWPPRPGSFCTHPPAAIHPSAGKLDLDLTFSHITPIAAFYLLVVGESFVWSISADRRLF